MKRFLPLIALLLLSATSQAQTLHDKSAAENAEFIAAMQSGGLSTSPYADYFRPKTTQPVACGSGQQGRVWFDSSVAKTFKGCNGTSYLTFATTSTAAPIDATYITQTANASLTNEQPLASLSSGIMRVATTTGVITSLGDTLPAANGGTGQDTSASTGVPYISSGTWAAGTAMKFDGTQLALGFGSTAPPSGPMFSVASTISTSPRGIASMQFSTDTNGARLGFFKARGTVAVPTTVVTGDTLGRLMFRGYDGTNYLEMGSIESLSTGTIAATRIPTQLVFSTATDAAPSVLTTALTLDKDQSATFAGVLKAGSGPTTLTDAAGKILSAALNTVAVAQGGTNCASASITCFNNITGFSAAGTTGTTSTNLVFSTSPTLVTPALGAATATTINGVTIPSATDTVGLLGTAQTYTATPIFTRMRIGAGATDISSGSGGYIGLGSGSYFSWSSNSDGSARDTTLSREAAGVVQFGTNANNNSGIADAAGYRIANAAASGNYLRGNGTSFVSNTIQSGDLPTALSPTTLTIGGGTSILKHLSSTATLDFANLAAIGCEDLTISVTGAALGDTVAIGIPNASVVANGTFTGWVSASNTVTVRFCTVVSGDPASGTFRADVWQH